MTGGFTAFDRWLTDVLSRYIFQIAAAVLILISLGLRIYIIPRGWSGDYNGFLVSWTDSFVTLGTKGALGTELYHDNYYVPYNLIIAIAARTHRHWEPYVVIGGFSCLCEYIGAFYIYRIARRLLEEQGTAHAVQRAVLTAVGTLYLPFAIMDVAYWKQCDAVYTAFIIISLYYLLSEHYMAMGFWYGIAFCFKLQAIFVLPAYLVVYVCRKRFSILQMLWLPVLYLLTGLPAILCGRSAADVYGTYFNQVGNYNSMSLGAENFYQLGGSTYYDTLSKPAIIITMSLLVAGAFICIYWTNEHVRRNLSIAANGCVHGDAGTAANDHISQSSKAAANDHISQSSKAAANDHISQNSKAAANDYGSCGLPAAAQDCASDYNVIYFFAWTVWTCFMFLPAMHERYNYVAVLLMSALALAAGGKAILCAIVMNLTAYMTYSNFLFSDNGSSSPVPLYVLTLMQLAAYAVCTYDLLHRARKSGL